MSDEINEQGCSAWSDGVDMPDLLSNKNSIKIDEKFVIRLTKESKNVNKEVKDSCKVLHFSSEWKFKEVLTTISRLDANEYPQLFIFIIEIKKPKSQRISLLKCFRKKQDPFRKLQDNCIKFSVNRPLILQLPSVHENCSKIYYKEDDSSQFTAIHQQYNNFEEIKDFPSILCLLLNDKIQNFEDKVIKFVENNSKMLLFLRFLRALTLSETFFERIILKITKKGSVTEFFAIIDAPFNNTVSWLYRHDQKYLTKVVCINQSDSSTVSSTSVLLTAIENKNTNVTDYLILNCTQLIQQLPFEHQVEISTAAFVTNQLDVLCNLVDKADFPFPDNFNPESIKDKCLKTIIKERKNLEAAIKSGKKDDITVFMGKKSNLKVVHNINNNSALEIAAELKNFTIFNHLKWHGFLTTNTNENFKNFEKEAIDYAEQQRKTHIRLGLTDDQMSVNSLCNISLIHNKKISKDQEKIYRKKIRNWYEHINNIENGQELLDVAASCNKLQIIFDFESNKVSLMPYI